MGRLDRGWRHGVSKDLPWRMICHKECKQTAFPEYVFGYVGPSALVESNDVGNRRIGID